MKKIIVLLFMCLSVTFIFARKNIAGAWEGKLNAGGASFRIIFRFDKQTDGSYKATMDSPDQGANGLPCDNPVINGDSVILKITIANVCYRGLRIGDSDINGNWEQSGMKLQLPLKRSNGVIQKPIEYNKDSNCIETAFNLETKTGTLYGTLCVPKGFVKGPVALLIAGSGPTDRDCNSALGLKCDAFKILAHKLAAQNIATVRYDKRGIGESRAALKKASDANFDDYINDAAEWGAMLEKDKHFTKVVIIGHSEGSLIGMIAARKSNANAYISVAGAGESLDKTLKRQLNTLPEEGRDTANKILDSLKAGKRVAHVDPTLYVLFNPDIQPFLISLFKYDPAVEIGKLTIPVLIIQGTNDVQLSVDDAKMLSEGNKKARLDLIENMNHIFRDVEGDRMANIATYNKAELPIDPKLVIDISDFINKK